MPGKIRLLDITSRSIVAYYRRIDQNCRIDAISFNPLSAELVVSVAVVSEDGTVENEILIMASMDRVVDRLAVHEKSVYFLMWDPTGTHLGTFSDTTNHYLYVIFIFFQQRLVMMKPCIFGTFLRIRTSFCTKKLRITFRKKNPKLLRLAPYIL